MASKVGPKGKYTTETAKKIRAHFSSYILLGELPTMFSVATALNITTRTLKNWANQYEDVGEVIEDMKEACASFVAKGALNKTFDPTFAKFLMKAAYGYTEKDEVRIGNAQGADGQNGEFRITLSVIDNDGT